MTSSRCETKLGANDNGGKNNVLGANKQSNKLHTAVSVAFSYLLQCRVKTGGKMLLFIVFQRIQQKGEDFLLVCPLAPPPSVESADKTINNSNFPPVFTLH